MIRGYPLRFPLMHVNSITIMSMFIRNKRDLASSVALIIAVVSLGAVHFFDPQVQTIFGFVTSAVAFVAALAGGILFFLSFLPPSRKIDMK